MPSLRRKAFSTPDTIRWTLEQDTATMRLDSLEAQEDANERYALLASRLSDAQQQGNRLDCITGHQNGPMLNMDTVMSDSYENDFQAWKMPRRAADPNPSRRAAYAPATGGLFAMPVIPEIVVSQSPAPLTDVVPGPRRCLKRKSDDSIRLEQPPAQRLHVEARQKEKQMTLQPQTSLAKNDNLHPLTAPRGQYNHQSLPEAAKAVPQLHRSLPKSEHLHELCTSRGQHNHSSFPESALALMQHDHSTTIQPKANLSRTLQDSAALSAAVPMPNHMWIDLQQAGSYQMLPPRPTRRGRLTPFPPLLPHYHKASLPPYAPGPQAQRATCRHWNSRLTQQICEWLDDPGTDSRQSVLTSIIFRNIDRTHGEGCRPVNSAHKLKITRMTISKDARMTSSLTIKPMDPQANLLDWFVIEFSGVEEAQDNHGKKYWLMAFPVCAITHASVSPAPTIRPDDFGAPYMSLLHQTTWTLGRNRLPILHGNGVMDNYMQDFFDACLLGEGEIVMESIGPLFSHA